MTEPEGTPDAPPEIERIPFSQLGGWAGRHLWANWILLVALVWIAAAGLFLLFVFAGPNKSVGFPELMYGFGGLLVAIGLQIILLDLLAEHHRANLRLYAEIGTAGAPEPLPDRTRGVVQSEGTPRVTLDYNAIIDAVRTLPLARFLIVAGLVTMFLGAGVDDLWDIPDITFTTGDAANATPTP